MRFSTFFTLLMVTFAACCTIFTNAENVANVANDAGVRRLRAEHAHKVVKAVVPGNPSKLAADFLSTTKEKAILTKAFQQAMAANGDEAAVKAAIKLAAGAKDAARMSDTEVAKISEMMAATAKKNPKSWPRLRKFAKITLGAGVGALAIYGAYKLLAKDNAAAAAVDTTGSA